MSKDPKKWCSCTKCISQFNNTSYPVLDHHMAICYLLKLLKSPIYYDTYDEHIRSLNEFLDISINGLFVNDLLHVSRVLQLLLEELKHAPHLEPYLIKLLDVCELPLILFDHSEEISGIFYVSEFMSLLGLFVIWLADKELRQKVYRSLFHLFTRKGTKTNHASLALRFKSVEFSYLPEIITQLVSSISSEELLDILVIVYALTEVSVVISQHIAKVNAMDYILLRLMPNLNEHSDDDEDNVAQLKPSREYFNLVNLSFEILLNLVRSLEGIDKTALDEITPSRESMGIVQYVLREVLVDNNKYIRNNIMEYVLLCLEFFSSIPFADSYLADDLATLCVATELDCKESWLEDIKFSYDESGIAFKKLLLLSLCYIHKYPTLHLIYENQCVIPGLLKMLAPNFRPPWHPDENTAIWKTVLICLYHIVPRLLHKYIECNGNAIMLILIEMYTMSPIECNRVNLEGSLKLLDRILEMKDPTVIDDMQLHNGTEVIIMLFNTILLKVITSLDQKYISFCFSILEHYIDKKLSEQETAITLVVKYLTRILQPNAHDSVLDPQTVICALDFLWQCLLLSNDNLAVFLSMEGVYILLDVIQMCPFPVQVIGLGCLVDMCTEESCIPFLLTWRGGEKKTLNFYSLLAEIFYKECKKIGTSLDSDGVITDTCFPLMAKQQIMDVFKQTHNKKSFRSVLGLQGSTRPKIYTLLQIMKTQHEDKIKFTNEYFKMANMSLSKKHKVILHLAENFFALKIGETWKELVLKLSNDDIKPIDIDGQMLSFIVEKMQKWNENVKDEQEQIVNVEIENETTEEYKVYELMKDYRQNEVMNAKREMIYFAKTSNRMFMLAEKQRENKEIGKYLKKIDTTKCTFHPTYLDHVNFTNVFHLKYDIAFNVENVKRDYYYSL